MKGTTKRSQIRRSAKPEPLIARMAALRNEVTQLNRELRVARSFDPDAARKIADALEKCEVGR